MRRLLIIAVAASLLVAGASGAEQGLVARWDFGQGSGAVLKDTSGNGNDGAIKGAQWVANGNTYALQFDGIDDHVEVTDSSSLDLKDQISIVAWIQPKPSVKSGEAGIAGKAYSSYVLTMYGDSVYAYVSGVADGQYGSRSVTSPARFGVWNHVAYTYDGKVLRMYTDGKLVNVVPLVLTMANGGKFWIGRSDGDLKWTQNAHFHGRIADLRVYNRALGQNEVIQLATTTNRTNTIDLAASPVATQGKVIVEAGRRRLEERERAVAVRLELRPADSKGVLASKTITGFGADDTLSEYLDTPELAPGKYEITGAAVDASGKDVGAAAIVSLEWAKVEKFPNGPAGARRLNNLVTELLSVPKGSGQETHAFVNPRHGWVHFANGGSNELTLTSSASGQTQKIALWIQYEEANEAMRELPAGEYKIATAVADALVVRAVPEIVYAQYNASPIVSKYGTYAGEFEKQHIFRHANTLMTGSLPANDPFVQEWKRHGGKWVVHCTVPRGTEDKPLTVQEAYDFLAKTPGYADPAAAGPIADEFGDSEPICTIYAKAVRKLEATPQFKDKSYYPFANNLSNGPEGRDLVAALVQTGGMVPWKEYLKEQPTEIAAWQFLHQHVLTTIRGYRDKCPGSLPHIIVCYGNFSAPNETLDTFPSVYYNKYLDMQFNLVATHPDFRDIGGIMTYLAHYTDEEVLRLGGKLFRHYGIEGKTEPFVTEPFTLTHLTNGDFAEGLGGWTVTPAEPGSIRHDTYPGFGWLEGRYPRTPEGDTVIVTKRSSSKPNVFAQEIKGLLPGKLYSFEVTSGDFKDMSARQEHAVSITIDGVTIVPEKSFTEVVKSCYSHDLGPYNKDHPAWMNYHWRVVRASGPTAKLTISDWRAAGEPSGAIGQELMFNFIQVQPYMAD